MFNNDPKTIITEEWHEFAQLPFIRDCCGLGQCVWCSNFASPGENPSGCRDGE